MAFWVRFRPPGFVPEQARATLGNWQHQEAIMAVDVNGSSTSNLDVARQAMTALYAPDRPLWFAGTAKRFEFWSRVATLRADPS